MDMNLNKLREIVKDREAWRVAVHGVRHNWATEQLVNITGEKGAGHNFLKNDLGQGHSINWLESNGSKTADKQTLIRPWFSISKLNDIQRGAMTVPRHRQKTKEWAVAQFLQISSPSQKLAYPSHSLADAITQSIKTNHATLLGRTHPLRWSTLFLWRVFIWIWINPLLTYHFASHWILSAMRHQEPGLH